MTRTVELHPEAELEARAARRWYRKRSPSAAEAFLEELDAAIAAISEDPTRMPEYLAGTRRCLLRRFPFFIVFVESSPTRVEVLAVAHARRRPGYWRERGEPGGDDA